MYGRHGFAGGENVRGAQTKTSKSPISCSNIVTLEEVVVMQSQKFFGGGGGGGGGGRGEAGKKLPPPDRTLTASAFMP